MKRTTQTEPELPGMPERSAPEEGSIAWTMDELKRYKELSVQEDGLVPPAVAADLLGVSRPCVGDLLKRGKLTPHVVFGRQYVSGRQLVVRMGSERERGGRPRLDGSATGSPVLATA